MSAKESLKYQKLLWSFVLIGAIVLFFAWRHYWGNHSELGYGFDMWALFMLSTWTILIISPVIILLRTLRIIKNRESFAYILTASVNFAAGTYGLFILPGGHFQKGLYIFFLMHTGCLLISFFIFTDTFINEIPGIRKT